MEAAEPVQSTPTTKKENNSYSWDIIFDNKEFTLELSKSKSEGKNGIIFKLINYKELSSIEYILLINEEEIKKLIPLFQMYKNFDKIYYSLFGSINKKQYRLEKKDQYAILTLDFYINNESKIDISFTLKEKQLKPGDYSIEKLFFIIQKLSEENKSIKEEFKSQNTKLKNDIISLQKELKDLKDKFYLKEIMENSFNFSKIIKRKEEKYKLISWISETGKIKGIRLLYSAKKDGDEYSSFYNKCSNISPTLSLIKTKKGRKFGGFTFGKWDDKEGTLIQEDSKAFLFSLDNMKNYKILKSNFAIFSASDHSSFLAYGNNGDGDGCGIYLRNNYLTKGGHENHASKVYNVDSPYCLSTEENFEIEEVEVYNIIFYKKI